VRRLTEKPAFKLTKLLRGETEWPHQVGKANVQWLLEKRQRAMAAGEARVQDHEAAQKEAMAVFSRKAQRAIAAGEARVQDHEAAQREAMAALGRRAQRAIAAGEARV
jgi:hypothetical protein